MLALTDRLDRIIQFEQVLLSAFRVMVEMQRCNVLIGLLLLEVFQCALVESFDVHLDHGNGLFAYFCQLRIASTLVLLENHPVYLLSLLNLQGALRVALHPRRRQRLLLQVVVSGARGGPVMIVVGGTLLLLRVVRYC